MSLRNSIRTPLRRIARALLLAISIPCATACYDSRFGTPQPEESQEPATELIAHIRKIFTGTPATIPDDITVKGLVTTSDRAGNFYRTLCIEQDGAALEILAGIDQLHNDFPIGCRVTVHLGGLTLAERLGVLQVGNRPDAGSGYEVDYLGSRAALDRVIARCSEKLEKPVPASLTIPELTAERCGTLVRITGLLHQPEISGNRQWSGYRCFVDQEGNRIYTYVRTYADFADEEIPEQTVSLTGILQYDASGDGRFLLKLRDEGDCVY